MDRWLINNLPASAISLEDRGLHYGDGLFETIAVRDGKLRLFDLHRERLLESCDRLKLPVDFVDKLRAGITELVAGELNGTLKIIVTRGSGPRGYELPDPQHPNVLMGFSAAALSTQPAARVRFCATTLARNPTLAGMKTLNRLEQVLARAEWSAEDAVDEGLMCNDRGEVVCGTMSNLFVVDNNYLLTPPVNESGVRGIMRTHLIKLAAGLDIKVRETYLQRGDLLAADAAFLTNALRGIWPVAVIDGQAVPSNALVTRLQDALDDSFAGGGAA